MMRAGRAGASHAGRADGGLADWGSLMELSRYTQVGAPQMEVRMFSQDVASAFEFCFSGPGVLSVCGGFFPDVDGDGDVDLADYLQMVECFSHAADSIASGCEAFDFDDDRDVDLTDLVAFQAAFSAAK